MPAKSPPLSEIRAAHAAKMKADALAKLPPAKGGKGGAGRVAAAILTGGASEVARAVGKAGKNKRGPFGEIIHGVGHTKGAGRVALAILTGGGSEVARLAERGAEKLTHGPGSSFPSRRNIGRLAARATPAHGAALEAANAANEGRAPRVTPPIPAGRIHEQRKMASRAKAGFYKHLSPEDVQQ